MPKYVKTGLSAWLEERYDIEGLISAAGRKMIPLHRYSVWYYLGGTLLFLFVLQIITGIMLMMYYRPTPAEAHASIVRIIGEIPFGWLIRSIHVWGAQIMVVLLLFHFFSTLLLKAYRKPRELTWITGMLLLVITLALGFSGYLLPWDELALTATRVGTDVPRAIGFPGLLVSLFLRGGEDVSGETLGRFFALHVSLLPLLLMAVGAVHIFLVQTQGMSRPLGAEESSPAPEELPFFPNFIYRDLAIWVALFTGVVTLAALLPPGIGVMADPLSPTPAGLKPEWYFLFLFQTIKLFPPRILILSGEGVAVSLILAAAIFFFLLPFIDRKAARGERSPVHTAIAVLTLAYFLIMTLWGYLS